MALYLPTDSVSSSPIDVDLAADYLELTALLAGDSTARTSDLANAASLGAGEDHVDLQSEMWEGEEEIVSGAVNRIDSRLRVLGSVYPFGLDGAGDVLTFELDEQSFGEAAYVLSLVLSNLRSVSPVLDGSGHHPDEDEVRRLRTHFQYCATAALAAEAQGHAWSFGFPRPDGSPFLGKLEQIWQQLRDGRVQAQTGAPQQPKDDQVDVLAAHLHQDRLPGFPLFAAQVATGANWRGKSVRAHVDVFKSRWFGPPPVTHFIPYMIVPFATAEKQFVDDVRVMGNVLHRLRVPRRVSEAARLVEAGMTIEGYDRLAEVVDWVADYRNRAGAPS